MNRSMETIGIQIPEEIDDPEQWLQPLLGVHGYTDWEQATKSILLPATKMLVLPDPDGIPLEVSSPVFLRAVLILARCNKYRYLPDGPLIFTRSRLNRTIRLIDLNTAYYYGME